MTSQNIQHICVHMKAIYHVNVTNILQKRIVKGCTKSRDINLHK